MSQRHFRFRTLAVYLIVFILCTHILDQLLSSALAEDLAELSLPTGDISQTVQEQALTSHDLFLHFYSALDPDAPMSIGAPMDLEKARVAVKNSPSQTLSPSLSWEKHEQTGKSLFINIQPHFTRDPVETARSPFDHGEGYQKSPLNSNDPIYGLGVATDYELAPWLHFNSAFRFNLHNGRANPGSSAASPGESTSHSLFFGVTVPFSASADD